MSSVIHIVEVALLLTIAYVAGWAIAYLVRRLTTAKPVVAGIPAERLAAATGEDALVKTPVIAPLPIVPPPPASTPPEPAPVELAPLPEPVVAEAPGAVAEPVPVTDLSPLAQPEPAPEIVPAAAIVLPTEPAIPAAPVIVVAPTPKRAAIKPPPAPEPVAPPPPSFTAMPSAIAGEPWSGSIKGRAATRFEVAPPIVEAPIEPELETQPEPLVIAVEPERESSRVAPSPEPVIAVPEPVAALPEPEPLPETIIPDVAAPPPLTEFEEDAAMRAIEGGWSRVRTRAMSDVSAAVAAAQSAVEQVLAQSGIDPETTSHAGKPIGLPRPRPRGKDNLRQIKGLSPLDESTLNNLGVFHFDQIANWDEAAVLWMENHVFARGRLGRETWQAQARELASAASVVER